MTNPSTPVTQDALELVSDDGLTFIQCGPPCEHDFKGWREFEDGLGGEQVCAKCGVGAMAWSMEFLP